MYCIKCGNKLDSNNNFCPNCGQSTKQEMNYIKYNQEKPKTNVGAIIVTIISAFFFILLITVPCLIIFFLIGKHLNDVQTLNYIEFGYDNIPTIYNVIGPKDICDISDQSNLYTTKYTLVYCKNELSKDDINYYLNYLIENESFTETNNLLDRTIIKDSYDENSKIIVTIDYEEESITYYKYTDYSPDSKNDFANNVSI